MTHVIELARLAELAASLPSGAIDRLTELAGAL
jgi:hypothetical protein